MASDGEIEEVLKWLSTLPQISEETRQYILMRALSWPDAFPLPHTTVMKILNMRPSSVREIEKTWSPWRSYATIHLWAALQEGEKS